MCGFARADYTQTSQQPPPPPPPAAHKKPIQQTHARTADGRLSLARCLDAAVALLRVVFWYSSVRVRALDRHPTPTHTRNTRIIKTQQHNTHNTHRHTRSRHTIPSGANVRAVVRPVRACVLAHGWRGLGHFVSVCVCSRDCLCECVLCVRTCFVCVSTCTLREFRFSPFDDRRLGLARCTQNDRTQHPPSEPSSLSSPSSSTHRRIIESCPFAHSPSCGLAHI